MSEIPCDCCNSEGDHPSRIICDACFESAKGKAQCCIDTQAENKQLKDQLDSVKSRSIIKRQTLLLQSDNKRLKEKLEKERDKCAKLAEKILDLFQVLQEKTNDQLRNNG